MNQHSAAQSELRQTIDTLWSLEDTYRACSPSLDGKEGTHAVVLAAFTDVRERLGQLSNVRWTRDAELRAAYAQGMRVLKVAFDAEIAARVLLAPGEAGSWQLI